MDQRDELRPTRFQSLSYLPFNSHISNRENKPVILFNPVLFVRPQNRVRNIKSLQIRGIIGQKTLDPVLSSRKRIPLPLKHLAAKSSCPNNYQIQHNPACVSSDLTRWVGKRVL